jgi:hypothetical protein
MPGAPNRPPEGVGAPAPPPAPDPPEARALRRLVPSHVALLQELWKGTVPAEVLAPFDKALGAFRSGDPAGATSALDQLSIRFAEPRWPSLPEPFRRLRVPIPAPVPPHWDPEHGLAAPEKEARQRRRVAEEQLALAEASVRWAGGHGIPSEPFEGRLAAARAALAGGGVPPEFYGAIDPLWTALESQLPPPPRGGKAPVAAAATDDA